jgi:hypothetical protein
VWNEAKSKCPLRPRLRLPDEMPAGGDVVGAWACFGGSRPSHGRQAVGVAEDAAAEEQGIVVGVLEFGVVAEA